MGKKSDNSTAAGEKGNGQKGMDLGGVGFNTISRTRKGILRAGIRAIPREKTLGSHHRPKNRCPRIHRLSCISPIPKRKRETMQVYQGQLMPAPNMLLEIPLCQWFLSYQKERQEILTSSGLQKLKQVDNPK